jgi:hypothetical protein
MTTETTASPKENRRLIPIDAWPNFHPWPTANGLRFYVKHRHTNGLDQHGAVLRVGRRILIDQDRFFSWIDAKNGIKDSRS